MDYKPTKALYKIAALTKPIHIVKGGQ